MGEFLRQIWGKEKNSSGSPELDCWQVSCCTVAVWLGCRFCAPHCKGFQAIGRVLPHHINALLSLICATTFVLELRNHNKLNFWKINCYLLS